jgi:ABC-type Fe3+-citrate transport system substrate-binding protein
MNKHQIIMIVLLLLLVLILVGCGQSDVGIQAYQGMQTQPAQDAYIGGGCAI